jgi:two-component system, cell cycle sensor histidine kinase and response regulator CckA
MEHARSSAATAGESALRVSIDTLLEGVQVLGFDWTYVYLNAAACQHGRRPREELLGRTMMECYPGIENTPLFATLERVMRTRRGERLATEFVYPDGQRGWFELHVEPVPDGICILSVDISEQRRVQAQFQQAQKMEAVGQLAGGIAHDFNNVLTAILGYCELLLERVRDHADIVGDVAEIHTAASRAGRLTRQLLAFSRKQLLQPEVLNLNQVVTELDKMLSRVIRDDVRVTISAAPALSHVKADRGQIEQVLVNLVINARDAMPQGGTIEIFTTNVTLDEQFARDHEGAVPGQYVAVAVKDSGTGMAPEVLRHVFEPFFTTKGPGKGTGLGLATVYGIVRQSGGYIWIDTTLGVGTTFTTYLPAVDEPLAAPPPATALKPGHGSETILLADDDPALRLLIRRVLQRAGYVVLEAQDVADAIALAERHPRPIDLFVSDIVMPEMNGPNLAQLVLIHQPTMKVLYISGFPYTIVPASQSSSRRVSFLAKPFEPRVLVETVRSCLDRD